MVRGARGPTILLVSVGGAVGLAVCAALGPYLGPVPAAFAGLFMAVATALLGSTFLVRSDEEP